MFLTRSIRRKMAISLALVMVMLATLSLGAIDGLVSYRNVMNELRINLNEVPHPAELVRAIAQLAGPLSRDALNPGQMRSQQALVRDNLSNAQASLLDFRLKLETMPQASVAARSEFGPVTDSLRTFMDSLLNEISVGLSDLEEQSGKLADPRAYGETVDRMRSTVAYLQERALNVPEPHKSLNETLDDAGKVYRSRFWLICTTAPIIFAMFLGLLHFGYRWIFAPIRRLHQGASRVAQGDFDYRVTLSTNDEMAELAEAFNMMTDRFQEVTRDLDRQVRERSKQLVRSERLAGVGFLAAGVAHEINNPLSAVAMAAESLLGRVDDLLNRPDKAEPEVIRRYLEMIVREAFRCRAITEKLLNFSRGQDGIRSQHDLTAIVTEVLAMLEHVSRYRDKRIVFKSTRPCYLEMDGPAIKQVVLNLVANGLESMENAGTLTIEILEQTDHVLLTVTDEGCGMTPEVLNDVFEPFFTQKKAGKGTGLGLSISHRIVSEHGGTIEAASDGPDKGSTFSVRLPRRPLVQIAA